MDMSKPMELDLLHYPHCFIKSVSSWDPSFTDDKHMYIDTKDFLVEQLHEQ